MTYFRRHQWGARTVPNGKRLDPRAVVGIALHWPGWTYRTETPESVMSALRRFQDQHMDGNDWRDIGYQEAIDQAGNVYRLRGLRYQSAANGNEDVNERYGALLLMLAIGENPSDAMIAAVRRRVARHQTLFPRSSAIVPHSAIRPNPTDCPGDIVRKLIGARAFNPTNRRA